MVNHVKEASIKQIKMVGQAKEIMTNNWIKINKQDNNNNFNKMEKVEEREKERKLKRN